MKHAQHALVNALLSEQLWAAAAQVVPEKMKVSTRNVPVLQVQPAADRFILDARMKTERIKERSIVNNRFLSYAKSRLAIPSEIMILLDRELRFKENM